MIFFISPSIVTQSPEEVPAIDPRAIHDLEVHARNIASNIDHITKNMHDTIHKVSYKYIQ